MHCTKDTIVVSRFKFQVDIIDDTGSITVAVCGENGRKNFSLEADQILSRQQVGQTLQINEVNEKLWNKTFFIQLQSYTFEACGESQPKYNIAWLYDNEKVSQKRSNEVESSSTNVSSSLKFVHDSSSFEDPNVHEDISSTNVSTSLKFVDDPSSFEHPNVHEDATAKKQKLR